MLFNTWNFDRDETKRPNKNNKDHEYTIITSAKILYTLYRKISHDSFSKTSVPQFILLTDEKRNENEGLRKCIYIYIKVEVPC